MKKWLPVAVLFLVIYLGSLVVLMPASVIVNQLELPKNVNIASVQGTIWHSHIRQVTINKISLHQVNVELKPWSLLLFNPTANISFGDPLLTGPEGQFEVSNLTSAIVLRQLNVEIAANLLASYLPLPIPILAKNTLAINIDEFQQGQPICDTLQGKISWNNAEITALDENIKMGALNATLGCKQGELVMTLDERNQLGVSFSAQLGANQKLSGQGYLTPSDTLPKVISQALPFLGRPDEQGRYRLAL